MGEHKVEESRGMGEFLFFALLTFSPLPFLKKKCEQHQLTDAMYSFEHVESLDLYKEIFKHRKRLKLENMKQKTLERFININRKDIYSGKEISFLQSRYIF